MLMRCASSVSTRTQWLKNLVNQFEPNTTVFENFLAAGIKKCRRGIWTSGFVFGVFAWSVCLFPIGQPRAEEKAPPSVAKIFYYDFDGSSLFALTEENIEENSMFKIQLVNTTPPYSNPRNEHPILRAMTKLLKQNPSKGALDNAAIRFKLQFLDEVFLVDAKGRVLRRKTGERFKLSVDQRNELGHRIENLSGVVDVLALQFVEPNGSKK